MAHTGGIDQQAIDPLPKSPTLSQNRWLPSRLNDGHFMGRSACLCGKAEKGNTAHPHGQVLMRFYREQSIRNSHMALTAKQEAFAQAVASGMTQADAYRSSYDAAEMLDKTIIEEASRVANDRNVSARVTELKNALAETAIWTRIDSLRALSEIATMEDARANEKVSAIKELNAMQGFNAPTKHEVSGNFTLNVHFD